MRSQAEIAARFHERALTVATMFDFFREVSVHYLPYEEVREALTKEARVAIDSGEEAWEVSPLKRSAIVLEMKAYMAFAWTKVRDHRGLSAGRSTSKMQAWMWILEDDHHVDWDDYAPYGAPILAEVCELYGFDVPEGEDIARMVLGKPCEPHCSEGCKT